MAIRGTSSKDEIKGSRRRKDTRLVGQKMSDFMNNMDNVLFLLLVFLVAGIAVSFFFGVPGLMEMMLVAIFFLNMKFLNFKKNVYDFPYRVPTHANLLDGSTRKGKELGKGTTYLGNETGTKNQIYISDSDLRTHMLVLGTTGSGKTEFLLGLCANALTQNSGFIYVDGKGDVKLQKDMFRLARNMGREDDLLLINFMTSGRDFNTKQADKVTNNMNLMANSSSGMLIELIVGMMDDSGSGGDMWKGRAIAFVAALTRPLVYLRDTGQLELSAQTFIDYMELPKLEEFLTKVERGDEQLKFVSQALIAYVNNIPGYNPKSKGKQDQKTLEQQGYITMQLLRVFNDLSFNYGHIFNTKIGDIDFYDVVLNRRILVVLLPAIELSGDSLRMLGKLIVGNIKQLMAGCLGNRIEGLVREIIDSRPTNANIAFYCILDEYGRFAVPNFSVAPAQARSLGFSIIFATQDFSSLKTSSAEEADATWENTNMRVIGRITSGSKSETWERIHGAAGEADVAQTTAFNRKMGMAAEKFTQTDTVSIERRSRIDYDDFAGQQDGEFTFIVGKKGNKGADNKVAVIRGNGFYTASKAPSEIRLNDYLSVIPFKATELPKFIDVRKTLLPLAQDSVAMRRTLGSDYQPTYALENISKIFELCSANIDRIPVMNAEDVIQLALHVYVEQEHYVENTLGDIAIEPIAKKLRHLQKEDFERLFDSSTVTEAIEKQVADKNKPKEAPAPVEANPVADQLDTTQRAQPKVEEPDNPSIDINSIGYQAPAAINLTDPITLPNDTIEQLLISDFSGTSLFKPFSDTESEIDSSSSLATPTECAWVTAMVSDLIVADPSIKAEVSVKAHENMQNIVRTTTNYEPVASNVAPEIRTVEDCTKFARSLKALAEIAMQENLAKLKNN